MARSRLTNVSLDLITDAGAILWSMVRGEQLEFPIVLNFILDATLKSTGNYIYEAVVIEAANVAGQTDRPTSPQPNGVQTRLFVRIPRYIGVWSGTTNYTKEDIVKYQDKYYKLNYGLSYMNTKLPTEDTDRWSETVLNKIYVQYPATLGSTWSVKPTVTSNTYGFFELRVTEPTDIIFSRTFKPIRGMVELLFSPTDEVADISNQTTP